MSTYILTICDQNKPAIGCGYYYIVTKGAMSHTAFRTKRALKIWLKDSGLTLGKRTWTKTSIILNGEYRRQYSFLGHFEFIKEYGHLESMFVLDNGDWVIGFIEKTEEGRIWHLQNPNAQRVPFDYQAVNHFLEKGGQYYKWLKP
jgi:hypothetical protein